MSMQELLFLAHRLPYPPDKGDKIRSYELLRHLAGRYAVHLGCFVDDPADLAHVDTVRSMCASSWIGRLRPRAAKLKSLVGLVTGAPLSFRYFADRRLRDWAAHVRTTRPLAVELAFSSPMACYLGDGMKRTPRIVDFVDLDSEKWRQYSQHRSPPARWLYALEARRLAAAEVRIAQTVEGVVLCSDREAADLRARPGVPGNRVSAIGNGVDLDYFRPMPAGLTSQSVAADSPLLVFTGMMDYWANIDGIVWFVDSILPKLRAHRPDLQLAIVGARPTPAIRMLAERPGITVTGRVPDVRPWLARATVAVIPLRIARGIQNKVLEAMAMGCAVVATPAALTGVQAQPDVHLLAAEGEQAFVAAVERLLVDADLRRRLGLRARRLVEDRYAWTSRLRALDELLAGGISGHLRKAAEHAA